MSAIGMGRSARQAVGANAGTKPDFTGRLLTYIPADIVGGYVAVVALADRDDASYADEWIISLVFLVLAPFVVLTAFWGQFRKTNGLHPKIGQLPWFRASVAPVAYAAWVFAMPDTPAQDWGDVTGVWQTLVLVSTTLVLGGLGAVLDD